MKLGFLFAGQGAQYVGMGKDLYEKYDAARKVYEEAKLDFDVVKLCFEGPLDLLNDTAYAQSCIFITSMAIAAVVQEEGIHADYAAGLSLGEYSALCYAKTMTINEGASIVRERGKLMANALPKGKTMMAAVLNTPKEVIDEVCAEVSQYGICEIANYNCPGQIVITGEKEAVQMASERLLGKGARRVIPLKVSGAFHSSLLDDASHQLNRVLANYDLKQPSIPIVYNISGKEENRPIQEILTKQIKSSVHFMQSIQYMIDKGVNAFVEIGPGNTLSGFVRKIDRKIPVYSVDNQESLLKMLGALK